jgi:hypothetical protein
MFLFEAIAGGVLYDMVKEGLDITTKFLKNKLKVSVLKSLTDEDLEIIVKQVNGLSDEIKSDRDKFESTINSSSEFNKLLSKIKCSDEKEDNKIIIENSFIEKSPIINIASGDVSINYGKDC